MKNIDLFPVGKQRYNFCTSDHFGPSHL